MEVGARDVHGLPPWHSQPLDRVTPPWLANPRPPAMSPHANGTRHPSHWFNSGRIKGGRDGGKRMIQRLNEENGRHENTVLSTWRWCKQGWPRLSQTTDRWPRSHPLLLTLLNKYSFTVIFIRKWVTFNSHRTGLGHQNGRHFSVLGPNF